MIKVGLLVAGVKGLNLFKEVQDEFNIEFISSYSVKGTLDNSLDQIRSICSEQGFKFIGRTSLKPELLDSADVIFVAGWQYLIKDINDRFVVLHDSLLPKFRGFAPTVTALISGERKIGVTAIKPSEVADRGPIYEQASIEIEYPIKIKDAYLLLAKCYAQVTRAVVANFLDRSLIATPQNDSLATYSVWRDKKDYYIDWSWPSEKIARFVDAISWPYAGARSKLGLVEIIIDEVEVVEDLAFVDRCFGKIWVLSNGMPEIICGDGMVRIIHARFLDGKTFNFSRLRERLENI